jgi:TM2 domain-containing membrane protein YozV
MAEDAPPGWYDVPSGGRRFWNGREWTPDTLGTPNAEAEYAALSPDLAPPRVAVMPFASDTTAYFTQPPGWYQGPSGLVQWWDGRQWGPYAPQMTRPPKDVGTGYLFLILLGALAAHRFYLGRIGSAVAFVCIWWGGWILSPILIGIPLILAAGIWWFIDLFLLPSMVREENVARLNRAGY